MDPILFDSIPRKKSRAERLQTYIKSLSGLVAYYPLDEASGNAINRAPATQGSLDGIATGATQGVTGLVGNAYSFDGVDDLITISDSAPLGGLPEVTIFFLINLPVISVFRKIMRSDAYDFGLNNSGSIFTELLGLSNGNSGTWDSQPGGGVDDDTWRLFTITYDGSQILGFLNGVVVETTASVSGTINGATSLVIGNSGGEWYQGLMQHIGFLNRALTPAEVLGLTQRMGL